MMMRGKTKILICCAIALLVLLFVLRGTILRSLVSHRLARIEEHHSLTVSYDMFKMSGLSAIEIENLCVKQRDRENLLSVKSLKLKMNPLKVFLGHPEVRELNAEDINISFIKKGNASNFDFLFYESGGKVDVDTLKKAFSATSKNYAKRADNILSMILRILPANADIKNFNVIYNSGSYLLNIGVPELRLDNNQYSCEVITTENGKVSKLHANGSLNDSERTLSALLYAADGKKFSVPFINFRWEAKAQFDTLAFELTGTKRKNDTISLNGEAMARGISVSQKRLSSQNVNLDKGLFRYRIKLGRDYLELDSCSVVKVNNFSFSPYIKAKRGSAWHLTASLNKTSFPADELFSSLPEGLFYNLEGIKTSGNLSYHLYFDIDFSNVDSLKLRSQLRPENFRIKEFGNTNFQKINGSFEYTAYERGNPVRSFIVGPENKNFRSLGNISPYLQMTVLQSEDGAFFYHRGFLPESMQEALAQDIKEKRFHRGGSTISMQLVKNVFLSRNKTLARKFEEVMIVWLIETNHLSTKERMFEVYLNIIEWGPGVYGANEAARFYFDKEASDINVNEAIFLSEIIPAPKWSLNSITDDLQLKPSHEGYFSLLAQRLRIKGLISETEEAAVTPEVNIRGEAKRLIQNRQQQKELQTVVSDTTDLNF